MRKVIHPRIRYSQAVAGCRVFIVIVAVMFLSFPTTAQLLGPRKTTGHGALPGANISLSRARIDAQLALRRTYAGEVLYPGLFTTSNTVGPVTGVYINDEGLHFTTNAVNLRNTPQGVQQTLNLSAMKSIEVLPKYARTPSGTIYSVYSREEHKAGANFDWLLWRNQADAQMFANAVNRLIQAVENNETIGMEPMGIFKAHATTWRGMATKPTRPEDIERAWVLAENAINEKDFASASAYYDEGIAKFDMWPEGYYNSAMVYAEIKLYNEASDRIKRYLELSPDAPDAKAARENMYIWEEKAKIDNSGDPTQSDVKPTPTRRK